MSSAVSDIASLKARLKVTWRTGDFGQIAKSYESGAAEFIERLNLAPGTRLLDVACGTGNTAIPAARVGAFVTGVDLADNLLEQGRSRAEAEGLKAQFDEGDAEQLPYDDASFDVVVSMFGTMFAPRPELVAAELLRVCRSGGRVALANWTAAGFIGQMFKTISTHVPPPPSIPSPLKWGDEETLRERLGGGVSDMSMTRRLMPFTFPFGPKEVVEFFRVYYGPTNKAFEAVAADPNKQAAMRGDLERLWSEHNEGADRTTHIKSEYLEVVATRS